DDVGAIAILHALADSGKCEILATISSNKYPFIGPTIEAFNRYFKRPDIPIGVPKGGGVNHTNRNHWNDSIVYKYLPEKKTNEDYPSAVKVYRQVLASQPDKSITIVTVGFTTNLANLLKSGADDYSPLEGRELIDKKVKKWVAMAGEFPEGYEFNVYKDAEASYYTFNHWPTPVLFSGFEIGNSILTGHQVAESGSAGNPVAWAYQYNLKTWEGKHVKNRQSWDQTAVLCSIENPEHYFYVIGPGRFVANENGSNYWDPETDAGHYFLVHKYPYQIIADTLDRLMKHEPN
ncbi:nucleoside hydrolase, partial [Bacteroidota bacterium]